MNIVAQLTTERQLVCQTSNGLHWTEMAALCPGVQYGLSSQQNFGENKDLIFVKLTDSALRAIEEYIKNQNKFSHNPTIKFLGNENGELSFPSLHHEGDGGATHFSFTMSSTADMEGQGGSFECIKQSPRGNLEGLGSIPRKIRVHANDDVYEATRHRMTEAEDKYKNKCTREIKPNQTDIGRKVKVKQSGRPMMPVRKEAAPSMRDVLLKTSSSSPYGGGQQAQPVKPLAPPAPSVHSSTNTNGGSQHQLLSNGLGSNHVSSSRPQPSKKPSVPDIAKRPLKERLIHLLAMKPFKKFELHDRLLKEGLREKNGITTTLRQVASMKDNCFHLNRAMWNEVHEDWPFYTDSERQMLKRRKPQNLTPPGGSDGGSSGSSGQSPTSTHPGSPPPLPAVSSSSNKRPGFRDGPDGFPYKRQRIAHTNRPPPLSSTLHQPQMAQVVQAALVSVQPIENNSQRRPVTDSRDASNMNPRSRESPTSGYFGSMNGCYVNGMLNDKRNLSDDEDLTVAAKKRSCDSHSVGFVGSARTFLNGRSSSPVANRPTAVEEAARKEELAERYISTPNSRIRPDDRDRAVKYSKERIARVSPDSQTDGIPVTAVDLEPGKVEEEDEDDGEFPDYKKDYVTIQDRDQRRQYKTDFNAHYAEYRDLHGVVEKVSKRFLQLEERLKQEDENSAKYKDIKKQIVREYQEKKKDPEHQKAKRRFQYLHDKLSFIKRLVMEYDQGVTDCRY